ncbi:ABC transporter substrate-binding protein [Streptomyces sp. NPDC098101]|uniref:ABC transporter substrate-binding protein n=1 Tax=Streptomyces sp. NPDC098101 TaxID=3366096 RepID=UPI0038037357
MTFPVPTRPVHRPRGVTALFTVLTLTTVTVTGCSASPGGERAEDGTVRVALVDAAPPSLPLLAERNGDFADQGLDVEISSHPSTRIASFAASLGWEYDIAWGTPADVIASAWQGHDITVIAGSYTDRDENQQGQIYAAESGAVGSVTDLRGKQVAVPSLSGALFLAVLTSLKRAGVDPEDVRFVQMPFSSMIGELGSGGVDAVATVQPYMGAVEAAGHRPLGDPFLSIDSPATAGVWIAKRTWAERNPRKISSFVAALNSADLWASSHEEDVRTFLSSALEVPGEGAAAAPLPDWDTSVTPEALAPWIEAMASSGQVHGSVPKAEDLVWASSEK